MGRLIRPSGLPNFSKAIISLWFRVPQASIDLASAESFPTFDRELVRTIPLLTLGPRLTKKRYAGLHSVDVRVDHWDTGAGTPGASDPLFTLTPASYGSASTDKISPCFVGLECSGGTATLTFNIQMSDYATVAGLLPGVLVQDRYLDNLFFDPDRPDGANNHSDIDVPGSGWIGASDWLGLTTLWDRTPIELNAQPEVFTVQSTHVITADTWHHLLLSFDLSRPCITTSPGLGGGNAGFWDTVPEGTSSYCKLWYAIDDVDYRGGSNMQPYPIDYNITDNTYGGVGDENGILTQNAWTVVTQGSTGYVDNVLFGPSTCDYETPLIPSTGFAFGIPASSAYSDKIQVVQKSRPFQIFLGQSLDTGIEAKRRLFIGADRHPVLSSVAAATLGPQQILFKSTKDWKSGKNSGSLGGTFAKTGTINSFSPGP